MRGIPELLLVMAIIAGYAGALFQARNWPLQTSLFPFIIGGIGLSLAIAQLIIFFTGNKEGRHGDLSKGERKNKTTIYAIGWILGFFGVTVLFGFQWGLPAVIFLYLKINGKEKLFLTIFLSVISWFIVYGLEKFLNLPFHGGVLFQ